VITAAEADRMVAETLPRRRVEHSRRVAATAVAAATRWGASPEKARIAGLLHDLFRDRTAEELLCVARSHDLPIGPAEAANPVALLHGPVAAVELRNTVGDDEVLRAIALHTVGDKGMTTLDKCIYLADFCEPGRVFGGVERVRRLMADDLDAALAEAVMQTLGHLAARRRPLAPGTRALFEELHGRA
jgi:predicted HD superfamily hydrolase involved in NAD metabolism